MTQVMDKYSRKYVTDSNTIMDAVEVMEGRLNVYDVYGQATSAAISSAISTNAATMGLFLDARTWYVVDDITITQPLILANGALITVATGKTLTISGPLICDISAHFAGAGTVVFGVNSIRELVPTWLTSPTSPATVTNYQSNTETITATSATVIKTFGVTNINTTAGNIAGLTLASGANVGDVKTIYMPVKGGSYTATLTVAAQADKASTVFVFDTVLGKLVLMWDGFAWVTQERQNVTQTETMTATNSTAISKCGDTVIDTTLGIMAGLTLANGTHIGDIKIVSMSTDGGDATLTVANHFTSSPEVFVFNDVGDKLALIWTGTVWSTLTNSGVTLP